MEYIIIYHLSIICLVCIRNRIFYLRILSLLIKKIFLYEDTKKIRTEINPSKIERLFILFKWLNDEKVIKFDVLNIQMTIFFINLYLRY